MAQKIIDTGIKDDPKTGDSLYVGGGKSNDNFTELYDRNTTVGDTTTLPPGSPATVENVGDVNNIILDFGIPEGEQGIQGPKGADAVGAPTGEVEEGNVDAVSGDTTYKAEPVQNEPKTPDLIISSSYVQPTSGNIISSSSGRDVAKYLCSINEVYNTKFLSSSSGTSAISFYDISDNWLGSYKLGDFNFLESTFTPPLNSFYFLITFLNSSDKTVLKINDELIVAFKPVVNYEQNLQIDVLEKSTSITEATPDSVTAGFYIQSDGQVLPSGTAGRFVNVYTLANNKKFRFNGWNAGTQTALAAYYDADDNFISYVRLAISTLEEYEFDLSAPNGATTLKTSYISNDDTEPYSLIKTNQYLESPIGSNNYNLLDYVKGQILIGEKYSLPYCDLYRESGVNYLNKSIMVSLDDLHYTQAGYTFISQQTTEFIRKFGGFTDLTSKTIGVFGGSFSVISESQYCKDVWVSELGVSYTDYGIPGYGFSDLALGGVIDDQVDTAILDPIKDIYILWCSTNDATPKAEIGNRDMTNPSTQSGGMNSCITKLIAHNPSAKILIFTSAKTTLWDYLYNPSIIRP